MSACKTDRPVRLALYRRTPLDVVFHHPHPHPHPPATGFGSTGTAMSDAARKAAAAAAAGSREEVCAALEVLAGLSGHEACVPLILESGDLGCLLQVGGWVGGWVRAWVGG